MIFNVDLFVAVVVVCAFCAFVSRFVFVRVSVLVLTLYTRMRMIAKRATDICGSRVCTRCASMHVRARVCRLW